MEHQIPRQIPPPLFNGKATDSVGHMMLQSPSLLLSTAERDIILDFCIFAPPFRRSSNRSRAFVKFCAAQESVTFARWSSCDTHKLHANTTSLHHLYSPEHQCQLL